LVQTITLYTILFKIIKIKIHYTHHKMLFLLETYT